MTCQECGMNEVKDEQGRKMLTDDRPVSDVRELLTS